MPTSASLLRSFVAMFFACFALLCFGQAAAPNPITPGLTGIGGLVLPGPISTNSLPCVGAGCLVKPKLPVAPIPLVPTCVADGCPREPLEPRTPPEPVDPCVADGCPREPIEPRTPPEPVDPCVADGCPRSPFTSDVKEKDPEPKDENEPDNRFLTRQEKCHRACNDKKAACVRDKKNGCDMGAMTCYTACL